jgi:Protein phosphatase 2C
MVVREEGDEGWSYVFWPQHGEYINSTNFVTASDACLVMEFAHATRRIESFCSFSDGIESLVLHYATKTVHDPFFNTMIEPVRASLTPGLNDDLSESLIRYLSSERVCDRTDDDKSLVLATRSSTPPPSAANDPS